MTPTYSTNIVWASKGDEEGARVSIVFRNIKKKLKYDDIKAKVTT
jgi:hypothetical protein